MDTRFLRVLEGLDDVLDVGGVYDPSRDRYDGHQKGFGEVFGHGFSSKLGSAGLVYKHFGNEIIAKEPQLNEDNPDVHRLFLAVYKSFIFFPPFRNTLFSLLQAIDAINNGINHCDMDQPPRYVKNTHNVFRVGRLNLNWTDPDQSHKKENEAFERAMAITGNEIA